MIFRCISRRPDEISGQVAMDHSMLLSISMYQYLVVAVPMVFIAVYCPAPFVLGGLVGVIMTFVVHCVWIMRFKKQAVARVTPNPGDGQGSR